MQEKNPKNTGTTLKKKYHPIMTHSIFCKILKVDIPYPAIVRYSGVFSKFNSLVPGKFEFNFRHVIFKQILGIDGWGISMLTQICVAIWRH